MNTEDLQKQFNKEFTEQAIILDKYMSKCNELEQRLSACEVVLEDTQKELQETKIKNKNFICEGCKHELPNVFQMRTSGWCYLCDPNISVNELLNKNIVDIEGVKQSIAEDHGFIDWNTLIDKLTESNELTLLKIYIDEVIVGYADAKIYNELEAPYEEFENKVLKTLKSLTLSMAAHPDCVKGSEFFDLVSIAEKVLEGTLDTRHG